jgi:hypothetical protein
LIQILPQRLNVWNSLGYNEEGRRIEGGFHQKSLLMRSMVLIEQAARLMKSPENVCVREFIM